MACHASKHSDIQKDVSAHPENRIRVVLIIMPAQKNLRCWTKENGSKHSRDNFGDNLWIDVLQELKELAR